MTLTELYDVVCQARDEHVLGEAIFDKLKAAAEALRVGNIELPFISDDIRSREQTDWHISLLVTDGTPTDSAGEDMILDFPLDHLQSQY